MFQITNVFSGNTRRDLYREVESYVSHHQKSKHQCTRLGSVPNLNSQASSPFSERWKPPYQIWK